MSASPRTGAELICKALADAGIDCVFGLPGTQNVLLFDAMRGSGLRTVVATHELSAAMMANGYYRASGRVAALATIPGPGFTWAMTGLAEAFLDSAALVHIVGQPARSPGAHFQLQAIDQQTMASPVAKAVLSVDHASDIARTVHAARASAAAGEPGPVLVHVARSALDERADVVPAPAERVAADIDLGELPALLERSPRVVVMAGQGAQEAAADVQRLCERLRAVVVTSTSGRGVVPEDHPLSLGFELGGTDAATLNALIAEADLVLAIGCKFSHNASRGFRMRLAQDKLVHVDAAQHVLGANYPARLAYACDAGAFVRAVLARLGQGARAGFDDATIARFRAAGRVEAAGEHVEPRFHGVEGGSAEAFFAALRDAMPRASHLVTDSGLHQVMARRHFRVLHPRGFMTPTNLQSMGFAIGAAIGAVVASPHPVVALLGDGGLAMSGLELLTAVRQKLKLTAIVFVDGAYGLIRAQQLEHSGRPYATEFVNPDIGGFAEAIGVAHLRIDGSRDARSVLKEAIESDGVTLVEVAVGDSTPMHWMRARGIARSAVGPTAKSWLRRLRRR